LHYGHRLLPRQQQAGTTESGLTSDFLAARLHLERAYDYLHGNDETSRQVCVALDLLIEAVATSEHARPRCQVVQFRKHPKKHSGGR
jgi:hypothetical protein